MVTNSVMVRFLSYERQAFAEFCMALREDGIPFSLGGSLTIFLPRTVTLEELPENSQKLLKKFLARKLKVTKIYEIGQRRRKLLTPEEYQRNLKRAAKKLKRKLGG